MKLSLSSVSLVVLLCASAQFAVASPVLSDDVTAAVEALDNSTDTHILQKRATYAIAAFGAQNCDIRTIKYTDSASSFNINAPCKNFGQTVNSVNWNGDGFWCVNLQSGDCGQGNTVTRYLRSGVSGCQGSAQGWKSFSLVIPSGGFAC